MRNQAKSAVLAALVTTLLMAPAAAQSAPPAAAPAAVYPSAIDSKFANEKPTPARMHTCAAQFKANKATNANGGLKWVQKGGGYWSECNKRLKEAKS